MINPTHRHKPDFLLVLALLVVIALTVTVAIQYQSDGEAVNSFNPTLVSR